MPAEKHHLSDEALLQYCDHELASRQALKAREHVSQCDRCRERLDELKKTSAFFADFQEQEIRARLSRSTEPRDRLRKCLAESSRQSSRSHSPMLGSQWVDQVAGVGLAFLIVVGGVWIMRGRVQVSSEAVAGQADTGALPRRMLTPGSTRAIHIADVCGRQDISNDPPVDPTLKRAVFHEYGVSTSSKMDYKVDYLITPSLGGTGNIQNLWPEPSATAWNARAKDQLEDHLHDLFCHGKIQLATAQNDIATDWIAAYKRYFKTDRPEPVLSTRSSGVVSRQELNATFLY
jgi:hypothetical protein